MKALPNNLKKARQAKGWTQDKAAKMLGVGRPAYAAWEEARALPKYEAQEIIKSTFKITDWKAFCEDPLYDTDKGAVRPAAETPENILKALQENYLSAEPKVKLAVNILLELVEVE